MVRGGISLIEIMCGTDEFKVVYTIKRIIWQSFEVERARKGKCPTGVTLFGVLSRKSYASEDQVRTCKSTIKWYCRNCVFLCCETFDLLAI